MAASPNATVQIKSNTKWSGSIMDSGFDSATRDGYGDTDQKVGISAGNYRFSHIAFGCLFEFNHERDTRSNWVSL